MTVAHKEHIARRFAKQAELYKEHATVQREICNRVLQLLAHIPFSPVQVLEIGCGVGFLTEQFLKQFPVQSFVANDIAPSMGIEMQRIAEKTGKTIQFVPGDAETINFNGTFSAILSASTVQWFHNVPLFLQKLPQLLQAQGIVAFSTFGTANFHEIAALTGKSLHYYSAEELCAMLAPNFQILHSETFTNTLYFSTPACVLRHIRQTGVNNFVFSAWTRSRLQAFSNAYCEQFSTPLGVSLTYNPIIIIAQKTN